jgi:hypothetical protein
MLQQEPPCPCSAETRQLAVLHLGMPAWWGAVGGVEVRGVEVEVVEEGV